MRRRSVATAAIAAMPALWAGGAAAAVPDEHRLAERFAETLSAHDIAGFAALFADHYTQHQSSAAAPKPPAGRTPKQLTVGFFAARIAAFPDLVVTAAPIVASPGWVAANFTYAGTQRGAYLGVAPTGRHVSFNSTDILQVAGGKFVAHWGAADIAGLMAQLRD